MGNKLKDFLFKNKDENEFDTQTIELNNNFIKEDNHMNTQTMNKSNNSSKNIITPCT